MVDMLYNLSSGASCRVLAVVMKVNANSVATSQDQDRDEDQDRDLAIIGTVKIGGRPSDDPESKVAKNRQKRNVSDF